MIDALDKQTHALPLEPKRGRGRPKTGQAMTAAKKQKAYRERQKAAKGKVTVNAELPEWADSLGHFVKEMERRLMVIEKENLALRGKVRELASRPAVTESALEQYHAQSWNPRSRKWVTIGDTNPENPPFNNWQDAEKFVKEGLANGSRQRYRIVPANLPVNEYK
ncbi:hypothetical protein [Phytopseudomonas daroniae]|uniref:hypothetical protein n=1 Tax=Phytopseudomonas daroniae TaxID=2487519 RepID=UPI00103843C2|nr:hypothetical protein [Pseudomonas daroniae]TBU73709.1 hypothetical protein DNK10_17745 [Pseudomonas daroniae]